MDTYKCKDIFHHEIRLSLFMLCFLMTAVCLMPLAVHAKESGKGQSQERKVVRAGWFDSSFCYYDQFGRRCGIAYEYQRRIAAYTGWTYEYVEDSWPNLMQMLEEGKIDLMCDVSFKPERTEFMLFPDLPMGTESYYIYINEDNREITSDNLESFNGTRIGVNKGSIQEGFLKDWAKKNNIDLEVVPLVCSEDESMEKVIRGELDGYAAIFSMSAQQEVVPICRVGSSDYFYAVNKKRPDLLAELNVALAGIQDEDPSFNQRLTEERLFNSRMDTFFTPAQEDWIEEHGSIRVGYLQNGMPFCQTEKGTGELTGALKDYLAHVAHTLGESDFKFETMPFTSVQEEIDALKAGKVDCIFPVCLSSYDSEQMELWLTNPAMSTEMNVIMRASDNQDISPDTTITFAVAEGDMNVQTFIMKQYPQAGRKTYPSAIDCYEAVASGDADCILSSNYRIPSMEETLKKYKLISVPSGESMPLSFAVNESDQELYFILNKTVIMTKSEEMDSALASYMHQNQKVSYTQFFKDNWLGIIGILTILFAIILFLLLQRLNAEKKIIEQQSMMEDSLRRELQQKEQLQSAMEMAYKDPLTGVKSKRAYNEAVEDMDQRIAAGTVSEFSVVVFDLNDLKVINDKRGHEAGDEYIKDACKQICTCFKHSPVFRIGGDEFVAILEREDYAKQDELLDQFEKQVLLNLDRDKAVVSFGCSRFNPRQDKSIRVVFERADVTMYREKTLLKSLGAAKRDDESKESDNNVVFEDISVANLRKHILIADDVESNREILGDLLSEDYDIMYAADGAETLEILRKHKDEIAVVLLDLYMPNMTGREVMMQMQVDEELMSIPVIFISIDQDAELDCLKCGAMDFIPKPYPSIDIIKARINRCIELAENRDLIQRTQKDKLTNLYNKDYFIRYVDRYDQHYKGVSFDAAVCKIKDYHLLVEQYGQQFGDLVLRSVGLSTNNFARKTGGIGCREEGSTFLFYCPHQKDFNELITKFLEDLFIDEETASRVTFKFGFYAHAQQEPDIETRFARARKAADSIMNDPQKVWEAS